MARLPEFKKGQSSLNSTELNELSREVDRLKKTGQYRNGYEGSLGKQASKNSNTRNRFPDTSFLACIQAYALEGPNRWRYSWQEIYPNFTSPVEPRQGGDIYENLSYAWNTCEMFNTDAGVQGNSINISNIGNLKLQPVGGRRPGEETQTGGYTANTVVVRLYPYIDPDSGIINFTFQYENAIDGEC